MSKCTFWIFVASAAMVVTTAGCGQDSVASPGPQAVAVIQQVAAPTEPNLAEPKPAEPGPESPKPAARRPPADRTPTRAGEAEKITFDDLLLGMTADMVYREFLLTDRVKELDGKRLSLSGYMEGSVESTKNIKEFILLKNTECKFGPGGQADHLAQVFLQKGSATVFTPKPLKVEATLKVEPFQGTDGNTWAIYRLEDAKIVR